MTDEVINTSPFAMADRINLKQGSLTADELKDRKYSAFVMNSIYSNTQDTIYFANEINSHWSGISDEMHFNYFYKLIPKKKRFGKWNKESKRDVISLIKEYFGYSTLKAKQVEDIIVNTPGALEEIEKFLYKGGLKK